MLKLAGKHYVERVIDAVVKSGRFEKVVAAVSPKTPRTRKFLTSKEIEIIDTPGAGYPQDLAAVLSRLAPERVVIVPADIPLITPGAIGEVTGLLAKESEPAVSLVFEKDFVEKLGITPSVLVGDLCHSGITLFDSRVSGQLEERYVILNSVELAVNVNTKREKELAESLVKRGDDLAKDLGL
jgi:adenosylcobinamide-phosphate guanylyltransferase